MRTSAERASAPGTPEEEVLPLTVEEARLVQGSAGAGLRVERALRLPSIPGVAVARARTFEDERRVLVVSYDRSEPPGTLGYSVVVRSGHAVGDHYHLRREERILLLHGRAEFRLLDERPDSPARGVANLFTLEQPGASVRVPAGVAHAVRAVEGLAVLQVLASSDYDPEDDVRVRLSPLPIERS